VKSKAERELAPARELTLVQRWSRRTALVGLFVSLARGAPSFTGVVLLTFVLFAIEAV